MQHGDKAPLEWICYHDTCMCFSRILALSTVVFFFETLMPVLKRIVLKTVLELILNFLLFWGRCQSETVNKPFRKKNIFLFVKQEYVECGFR